MKYPCIRFWRHLPEERPLCSALFCTLLYLVFAVLYIRFSGQWAAEQAGTIEDLHRMEVRKGLLFVILTALAYFLISLGWWRSTRHQRNLLMASERRAVASLYSATLAHDLNNMLMVLGGLLDQLKDSGCEETTRQFSEHIQHSLDSLSTLSKRIATSARVGERAAPEAVALHTEIRRILHLARSHPSLNQVRVVADKVESVLIPLPPDLFEQMLLNLLLNAGQVMPEGGTVELRLLNRETSVVLEVHDSGPGIPEERREDIFRAGFSTKPGGCGIGLLTVRAFAAAVEGSVTAGKSPLGGALFTVTVPKA